jgi:hypothetical protein
MGYTHYFPQQRDFTTHEWSMIKKAFSKLHNNLKNVEFEKVFSADYCSSFSVTGKEGADVLIEPETSCGWDTFFTHKDLLENGEAICFNGGAGLSHETFLIEKSPKEKPFSFCKTNGKPYDLMVTSMLIVCAGYAGGALKIGSDGDVDDWAQAIKFVSATLNKPTKISFDSEGNLKVEAPTTEEINNMEFETIFKDTFVPTLNKKLKKVDLKIVENTE